MRRAGLLLVALLVAACSAGSGISADPAQTARPGPASGAKITPVLPWTLGAMVSAANPHAVAAAADVLAAGGHAVDAAIAAHAVLGLVEPESSGLGGSAFMMVYERKTRSLVVYDGRETAPAGARADMFLKGDGEPLGFREAWQTGLAVGVPGTVALYEAAHEAHGRLPWPELLEPAIGLADRGFEVSPKLHNWLARLAPMVDAGRSPDAHAYFYPDGEPLPVGYVRDNPEYARTLRAIALEGADAFYRGEIALDIASRAQAQPMPGPLVPADLARYDVVARPAVCGPFREYRACSAPPPSSGVAQIMILNLYDRLLDEDAQESGRLKAFVDAQRLAYADRDRYVADADFVEVPIAGLIHPDYLDLRAAQRFAPDETPAAGDPGAVLGRTALLRRFGPDATLEAAGTSHFSIVDSYGNAVAMTASVGAPFGSLRMVHGFLLNNEMSDFARSPTEDGRPAANAIEPGKRPRSSMSPTMLFGDDGELFLATGSPGGNSIVAYVAKSILGVLDWGLTAPEAADFPNIIARGATVRVENTDEHGQAIADTLAGLGYDVQESQGENSGIHLIVVRPDRLEGAADSRREGEVRAIP